TELFSRNVAAFADFLRRCVELMYFVGVPVAVIGALLSRPLIELFGDRAFVERGAPTLAMLFIAVALRFVTGTLGQGLFACHHQKFLFRLSIATLAFNVTLNVVLDRPFGAVGAGLALVGTELFGMVAASWWLRRECVYRTPVAFLLRLLGPTAACVAVALLLSGHHVVLILAAAGAAYLLTSAAIGPFTWSFLAAKLAALRQTRVAA
ncbi:MAG: polysaccharide biosynthesis C-terminal domain-containing protein, partial [Mycobacterium sp.]